MIYIIGYLLLAFAVVALFVYYDKDLKRCQLLAVSVVALLWPIYVVVGTWHSVVDRFERALNSKAYSRWREWWDQPLRRARPSDRSSQS